MSLKITTAAAALIAATAIAGAASAQGQSNFAGADRGNPTGAIQTDSSSAPGPATSQNGPGPSLDASGQAGASAGASSTDTSGYNVGAPQTDPNSGAQIVTNGPVPDTRANRQRFGIPDSHAGRRTSASGN